jgi:hypothetical protein
LSVRANDGLNVFDIEKKNGLIFLQLYAFVSQCFIVPKCTVYVSQSHKNNQFESSSYPALASAISSFHAIFHRIDA